MTFDIYDTATSAWVSIVPYVGHGGFAYSQEDVSGDNEAEATDGTDIVDRSGTRDVWDASCKPGLLVDEAAALLSLIYSETFLARYRRPRTVDLVEKVMRSSDVTAVSGGDDTTDKWDSVTFTLRATVPDE